MHRKVAPQFFKFAAASLDPETDASGVGPEGPSGGLSKTKVLENVPPEFSVRGADKLSQHAQDGVQVSVLTTGVE